MMPEPKKPSCCDDYDPNSLNVDQARERILAVISTVDGIERLALRSALDRVLAEDIVSPIDVPAYTNSAMDGYAVLASDLSKQGSVTLKVIGTALAGSPLHQTMSSGQCVRIMTGAKMPDGADTVIMQEHVERTGDIVTIAVGHNRGRTCARQVKIWRAALACFARVRNSRRRISACWPRWGWPRSTFIAACAWRFFPPAMNYAASVRPWAKAKSTIAIATRFTECSRAWA
jgi:hypothetical protein